jgi:hypothetical protein
VNERQSTSERQNQRAGVYLRVACQICQENNEDGFGSVAGDSGKNVGRDYGNGIAIETDENAEPLIRGAQLWPSQQPRNDRRRRRASIAALPIAAIEALAGSGTFVKLMPLAAANESRAAKSAAATDDSVAA